MPRTIIGLNGSIGVGKSTLASYLVETGYYKEYMLAGPLKEIAKVLKFGHNQVFGTQEQKLEINKHWNISGRYFLQKFGTEVCRKHLHAEIPEMNMNGTTLWVRLLEIELKENTDHMVVSDVRFPDEASKIREHGGIIIKLVDPRKTDDTAKHVSETQDIKQDVIIINDATLDLLYYKADLAIELFESGVKFNVMDPLVL